MGDPYYITTAISYPNGKPHIGHAYEAIAADVIARYQRANGRDVRFQTGTDEHGLKMFQKARDLGVTPQALSDEMSFTCTSLPRLTCYLVATRNVRAVRLPSCRRTAMCRLTQPRRRSTTCKMRPIL